MTVRRIAFLAALVFGAAVALPFALTELTTERAARAQDPPLGPTLVTSQAGTRVQPNTKTMNFVSGCTVSAPNGSQANVTCTGSGGSVTSISAGTGITLTPNPITTTGSVALTSSATTVNGQTCSLGGSCTVTAAPSGSAGGDLAGTYPNPTVAKGTFTGASSASGTASFDLSGASGIFKTSTGAVTVGPGAIGLSGNVTLTTTKTLAAGSNTLIGAVADKLNGLMLAVASQATGDILVADSSSTFARFGKCAAGQHLRYSGTTVTCSEAYTISGTLSSGTTGAGNVDLTVFSVPAGATSSTNSFVLNGVIARVVQAMAGSGSLVLSCGASAGAQDFLLNATITSATGVGTTYGLTTAQVGTSFTSGNMYNALINGSTSVICRSAMTGTVSTQAILIITVSGEAL